jgi:TetR/AcrR family transcriptional regulator
VSARVKGKKVSSGSDDVKATILGVARKHFALHGYQGASLKDIAEEAQVANSLLNYHFKDKAGLLGACMEPFGIKRMEAVQRILAEPRNKDELRVRMELFVEEMLASAVTDSYSHAIMDREGICGNPAVLKVFERTLLKAFHSAVAFFKAAQGKGLIRDELDPMIISALLFTSTCDAARKDILAKTFFNVSFEQEEWRRKFARHVVTLFLAGVVK